MRENTRKEPAEFVVAMPVGYIATRSDDALRIAVVVHQHLAVHFVPGHAFFWGDHSKFEMNRASAGKRSLEVLVSRLTVLGMNSDEKVFVAGPCVGRQPQQG